jgi:hypothetical protein
MHADARYADVLERVIYNGVLSGIALDGEHFFYVNPLASGGGHHRQPFYGCACCPTNVVRLIPSVPGYVYAQCEKGIVVNLYVAGTGAVAVGGTKVKLTQETRYPWDGRVRIGVEPEQAGEFSLLLRIPGWCAKHRITVAGRAAQNVAVEKGYARINRSWKAGDVVELNLDMPVVRVEAHPLVRADLGRVALQRGPIVYCFEAVDNQESVARITLPHDPKFTVEHRHDLLGGVIVIRGVSKRGNPLTAVPYYAWDHRKAGGMAVWVRQDGKATAATAGPEWQGKLYRPMDPATLGPSTAASLQDQITPSASHHGFSTDALEALCDGIEPHDSCDHVVPRFTWWDHRGTKEWVQYDFENPRKVSAVHVYWFDDERTKQHCRVPQSWRLVYKDGDAWRPVEGGSPYGTALDKYNRVTFTPITTTALRIEVQLKPTFSGGILEWKVE